MTDWKPEEVGEPGGKSRLTHARRTEIMTSLVNDFPEGATFEAQEVLERYPELQSMERVYYFLSTGVSSGKILKTAHRAYMMTPEIQPSIENLKLPPTDEARKKLSLEDRMNIFRVIASTYPSPNEFTVQNVVDLGVGIEQKAQINNLLSAAITRKEVIRVGNGKFRFDPAKEHIYREPKAPAERHEDAPTNPVEVPGSEAGKAAVPIEPVPFEQPAFLVRPAPNAPQHQPGTRQPASRTRNLDPRDLVHLRIMSAVSDAYWSEGGFSKGDSVRPTHRFRAEVYDGRYPVDLDQDLYPICLVIDEIDPSPDQPNAEPPPYDIFVAYVDDRGQVHTKLAGSWQFSKVERDN